MRFAATWHSGVAAILSVSSGAAWSTTLKETGVFFPFISWKHMGRMSLQYEKRVDFFFCSISSSSSLV
jgi:hypothetical protein